MLGETTIDFPGRISDGASDMDVRGAIRIGSCGMLVLAVAAFVSSSAAWLPDMPLWLETHVRVVEPLLLFSR